MLLRFRLENSRSFRDEGEISLIQSALKGPDVAARNVAAFDDLKALPCAVIYGANASGKSNLLRGFSFFRRMVLASHREGSPEGGVPRVPFALKRGRTEPSRFEADVVVDEVRYTLGFSCNDEQFTEEWLYSYPEGKKRVLYERIGSEVNFGGKFTGPKRQLVDFMRPNSLFISTATQNDHPELSKIVSYLQSYSLFFSTSVSDYHVHQKLDGADIDDRVLVFLKFIGSGVVNARYQSVAISQEARKFTEEIAKVFQESLGEPDGFTEELLKRDERKILELGHSGEGDETYFLGLSRESSGTRRLIVLLSDVFRALDSGAPILIDELDASLHTLASEEILKLFLNRRTNPRGSQIIVTTHDTNLLSAHWLRRDQIWFCERNEFGGSEVYSLSELKSRASDNFERGYLEGRYGAIPYAGDVTRLFGEIS